jgi:ribosomal protein L27
MASLLAFPVVLPKVLQNPTLPLGIRTATKRAGGFKAGSSDSAGKRRGVKKGGGISITYPLLTTGEWVRPGNIVLRQKGTQWHPGENVYSWMKAIDL